MKFLFWDRKQGGVTILVLPRFEQHARLKDLLRQFNIRHTVDLERRHFFLTRRRVIFHERHRIEIHKIPSGIENMRRKDEARAIIARLEAVFRRNGF